MNDIFDNNKITVSFIIIVRNGKSFLPFLFTDLLKQDFRLAEMEILFVDSQSTDQTLYIIQEFIVNNPEFTVKVLSNEGKSLSCGWNIALREAIGEIIIRVDAHSRIAPDFIRRNVENIYRGEFICGGYLESLDATGFWPHLAFLADSSRFGGSIAPFRNPGEARYVDTVAYASYRKVIFQTVGGYDERLVRNQDNEIHYRMHKAGFKFYYDPKIRSNYIGRNSVNKLIEQKFLNGFWIGITLGISPLCFSMRHFIPVAFVLVIVVTMLFGLFNNYGNWTFFPLFCILFTYFSLATYFSSKFLNQEKGWNKLIVMLLPEVFFGLHLAYGLGTIIGIFYMPLYLFHHRGYKVIWPVKPFVSHESQSPDIVLLREELNKHIRNGKKTD